MTHPSKKRVTTLLMSTFGKPHRVGKILVTAFALMACCTGCTPDSVSLPVEMTGTSVDLTEFVQSFLRNALAAFLF